MSSSERRRLRPSTLALCRCEKLPSPRSNPRYPPACRIPWRKQVGRRWPSGSRPARRRTGTENPDAESGSSPPPATAAAKSAWKALPANGPGKVTMGRPNLPGHMIVHHHSAPGVGRPIPVAVRLRLRDHCQGVCAKFGCVAKVKKTCPLGNATFAITTTSTCAAASRSATAIASCGPNMRSVTIDSGSICLDL